MRVYFADLFPQPQFSIREWRDKSRLIHGRGVCNENRGKTKNKKKHLMHQNQT